MAQKLNNIISIIQYIAYVIIKQRYIDMQIRLKLLKLIENFYREKCSENESSYVIMWECLCVCQRINEIDGQNDYLFIVVRNR